MSFAQPWLGWALASAAFAGLTAVFAKIGVQSVDSNQATLIRVLMLLPLVIATAATLGRWTPLSQIGGRTWMALALSAMATGASWLCYFRALQLGDAARVAPIDKLSVVLVAVFGALFLKEYLSVKNWLGVGLIAAGAILVAMRR